MLHPATQQMAIAYPHRHKLSAPAFLPSFLPCFQNQITSGSISPLPPPHTLLVLATNQDLPGFVFESVGGSAVAAAERKRRKRAEKERLAAIAAAAPKPEELRAAKEAAVAAAAAAMAAAASANAADAADPEQEVCIIRAFCVSGFR